MGPEHTQHRIAPLDGLRAVAVVAVLLFHTEALPGGSVGVDVFFVLSGYLIASILARELDATGSINIRAFLVRRACRLVPALALMLFAAAFVFGSGGVMALRLAFAASYTMNIATALVPDIGGQLAHTWSLAIEEQFYLLWPLVLLGLLKLGRRSAGLVLIAAWLGFTAARAAWVTLELRPPGAAYYLLHPTGLILGSAVALCKPHWRWGPVGLALLGGVCLLDSHKHVLAAITLAELASALLVINPPSFLGVAPLRQLGRVSYGVYLWHIPIIWALNWPTGWAGALLVGGLSVGVAALSWRYIEQPILSLPLRWGMVSAAPSRLRV